MKKRNKKNSKGETILVSLDAMSWTIAFRDCADVVTDLETILHGWDLRRLSSRSRRKPHAWVTKTKDRYCWRSRVMPAPARWHSDPPANPMHAIWDIHDLFFDWFLKKNPRHLCLHTAAVRIGAGLVCFPSVQKAGKSTLCIALAAAGHTLYCDDVLPIATDQRGVAMGIDPILRKPLPPGMNARLLRFIADRAGPMDRRWSYVNLRDEEIAPLGEAAPIEALILLKREQHRRRAAVEPVSKSKMLREILLQNFARQVPPVETLDRLLEVVEHATCCQLRYAGLSGATKALEHMFTGVSRRG